MPSDAGRFGPLTIFLAGILGAAGIAAAAGASHIEDARILGALALVALTHASALVAFGLSPVRGRLLRIGAMVITIGACVFCADLAARHFLGSGLFPMSAPLGGTAIIAGWLTVSVGGLLSGRRPP